MSRKKRIAFKLVALALPFLLIFLLEIVLRLFNYGHDLSLFVNDKSCPQCIVFNRYASLRFFTEDANSTMGDLEPFQKDKVSGTKRIFVLGESTALGYPYMHNAAFHRWLKYRLLQAYPNNDFEIINLSLTGVNSYTVLEFAKELPAYQPDAVLIYCGHNEYYGALGGASTSSLGNVRWFLSTLIYLKQYRTVQLLFNTFSYLKHQIFGKPINIDQNLMERMAANKKIAFGSKAYTAGIQQFRHNINEVCADLSKKKVPVFISTVVSNELSLPPFVRDSTNKNGAIVFYNKGIKSYQAGNFTQAKQLLMQAKEQDMLRFRAPEEINHIIKSLPSKFPLVYVVDSKMILEQNSSHGILDSTTLLEHVHPNLKGYALISEAFYQHLKLAGILPRHSEREISLTKLRQQMPITVVDSFFGELSIALLKRRWPFNQPNTSVRSPKTVEGELAMKLANQKIGWNDAMDRLMTYYEQTANKPGMLKVAEAVILEYPLDANFYSMAGRIAYTMNDYEKATNYLGNAFRIKPSMNGAQLLFSIYFKRDMPEQALPFIQYGLRHSPNNQQLKRIVTTLSEIIQLKVSLKSHTDPEIRKQIADKYKRLGNDAVAVQYKE